MAAKSAGKPNTKVTKTIDGVKVTVDVRAFSDMRLIRLMAELFKLDKENEQAGKDGETEAFGEIAIEMMDKLDGVAALIFGDECEAVQEAFAAKNDGYLSFDGWMTFISETIEAYQKNANARPAPEH